MAARAFPSRLLLAGLTLALPLLAQEAAPNLIDPPVGLEAVRAAEAELQPLLARGLPDAESLFGPEWHRGRREALAEAVKSEGLIVLRGLPRQRAITQFHQDKRFWYLTGVRAPDCAMVHDAKSGRTILFLPEANPTKESWEGEFWDTGDTWVTERSGIAEVRPNSEILRPLEELGAKDRTLWTVTGPWIGLSDSSDYSAPYERRREADPLDGRISREKAFLQVLQERFEKKPRSLDSRLGRLRVTKTKEEITALRIASGMAALAMNEAIRSSHVGVGEWELRAVMDFHFLRYGAHGAGYRAIIGSGANSLVLHYGDNTRRAKDGEVILIDYGPEALHYVSDVTRTWPANGKFTERQAELYDAVLKAQLAGIAAVKPGRTMRDIDLICSRSLRKSGFRAYIRHGSCHTVGLEVHDTGGFSPRLRPGVAFTIEPGLYDPKTGIGIRIEDTVLVTEEGCEVMSRASPKDRETIEAMVAERGMLKPR